MIKLIIVEDSEIVREALARFLNRETDMSVIGQVDACSGVMQLLIDGAEPDIILTDLNMPNMDGIQLTMHLHVQYPAINVIILTMCVGQILTERAREAGVKAYILKEAEINELTRTIRRVANGENCLAC